MFYKNFMQAITLASRLPVTFAKPLLLSTAIGLTFYTSSAIADDSTGYKVHLQDADIKAFIDQVASITNKNFVLDPRITGNVTVISNKALSKAEIYDLFLAVMKVNGVVAMDRGNVTELIPDTVAKQAGIDVDLRGNSTGPKLTTRIFYLTNTNANDILTVIRPLMPQFANAAAVPNVNALILSDRADSLNEVAKLIRDLDSSVNDRLTIIPLQHVDAQRMVELLGSLTAQGGGASLSPTPTTAGAASGSTKMTGSGGLINIIADTTADRLLVKGSPEMTAKVQNMVAQLDTVPSRHLSGLKVFRLKYASAPHIAEMLRGLLANQSLNSVGDQSTLQAGSMFGSTSTPNSNNSTSPSPTGSPLNTNSVNTNTNSNANNQTGYQGRPFSIIADQTQNSVIVNANPELMAEIQTAIDQLDTRRAQVLIQAAIVEISGTDTQQLGVQWALGNANSGVGVINFNNVGASAIGLASEVAAGVPGTAASAIAGALLGAGKNTIDSKGNRQFYGAILQAINKTNNANLLSMPSILTLDNEKANILVGQNVPFVTGSYTTSASTTTNPFQTVDRQDVGINLNVIPHIGENGSVRLEISQEVSSIVDGTLNNASGVITNKNLIKTTVLADNQQTVALGGLMRDNSTYGQQKVPGLGDLPIFGNLFKSKNKNTDKTNLIVFLQPTILNDGTAIASMTEKSIDGVKTLQLVIDKDGTLKKVPLTVNSLYGNAQIQPATTPQPVVELPTNDLIRPAGQNIKPNPIKLIPPRNTNLTTPMATQPVAGSVTESIVQPIQLSTVQSSTLMPATEPPTIVTPIVVEPITSTPVNTAPIAQLPNNSIGY